MSKHRMLTKMMGWEAVFDPTGLAVSGTKKWPALFKTFARFSGCWPKEGPGLQMKRQCMY